MKIETFHYPPPTFRPAVLFSSSSSYLTLLCLYRLLFGGFKERKKKKKTVSFIMTAILFCSPPQPRPSSLPVRPSRYLTVQRDHVATLYKLPWGLPLPNQHCNVFSSVCLMFLDCYIVYMNLKKERKTPPSNIKSQNVFLFFLFGLNSLFLVLFSKKHIFSLLPQSDDML